MNLTERINSRLPKPEPQPIAEKMSPFMRRLREKQLPVKDYSNGQYIPAGSERGA